MKTLEKQERTQTQLEDEVARRAYELWEQDGYQHGNHAKHWADAEKQVIGIVTSGEKQTTGSPPPQGRRDRVTMETRGNPDL